MFWLDDRHLVFTLRIITLLRHDQVDDNDGVFHIVVFCFYKIYIFRITLLPIVIEPKAIHKIAIAENVRATYVKNTGKWKKFRKSSKNSLIDRYKKILYNCINTVTSLGITSETSL